jgi:diacylglycerol O-acyltransferase / wax synthase
VLVAALSGALREHLGQTGPVPAQVRAVVPFDLRAGGSDEALGNRFGLLFLALPTGTADPRERLVQVKRSMDAKKLTPEGLVVFALLGLVGRLSPLLSSALIQLFASKATLVLTNVAGPRSKVSMSGAPVDDIAFWVPQAGGLGLGMSILSYGGQLRVGIAADTRCVPEPRLLAEAFVRELRALDAG